jgi:hypothetical protein
VKKRSEEEKNKRGVVKGKRRERQDEDVILRCVLFKDGCARVQTR